MFVLVTGGSGSGKSEYAEKLLSGKSENPENLYYIATMMPFGEEGKRRIKRHQKQREGLGFKTIECYLDLETVTVPEHSSVLLECMSNLLANEMYDERGSHQDACEKILQGSQHLLRQCSNLVIVTNEVFSDGIIYEESTMEYIRNLGQINKRLAQLADTVVEVVYSIPVYHGPVISV